MDDVTRLLDGLNPAQRDAVSADPGHYLVLAGAGSGKTRVLTQRIAWLVEVEGIWPHAVYAVTFTNKAAAEMRGRVEAVLQRPLKGLWIGTFHGLAHRLLRLHAEDAGLKRDFQILDAADQLRLVKRVLADLGGPCAEMDPKLGVHLINRWKDEGLRPERVDGRSAEELNWIAVYKAYEAACARQNVVDFAELLLRPYELLQQQPALLAHYRQGVNLDTRSGAALLGRGEGLADPARWFRQVDGPANSRVSLPRDLSLSIGGVALRRSQQLLWRDVADFPPGWLQALDPQPETAVLAQSWRPRPLPFVMSAREHFLVSVVATPRALGSREARLRILAEPVSGGPPIEIQLPLRVRGLAGPLPAFLPERLVLSASRDQAIARNVLLTNDGDLATSLSTPVLTAPGGGSLGPLAARLRLGTPEGATGTLASGASRRARIEFLGSCSGGSTRLLAELRWPTPHGVAILPIEAATVCP